MTVDQFDRIIGRLGVYFKSIELTEALQASGVYPKTWKQINYRFWRVFFFLKGRDEQDCTETILCMLRCGKRSLIGCVDYDVLYKLVSDEKREKTTELNASA